MTYSPAPVPGTPQDPALWLALTQQQVTAPHGGALEPLPPARSLAGWLWAYGRYTAPGLSTSTAWALALAWHQQLPAGSAQPLWILGGLGAFAALAGVVSAAKRHGDKAITATAFAAAGAAAVTGVAAWTPDIALSALLWLMTTAAAYAMCARYWRQDRRAERRREHVVQLEQLRSRTTLQDTTIRTAGMVEAAHAAERAERAKVAAIIAASEARTDALVARETRALEPGQELDVQALLAAAGQAPREPSADERGGTW